MKDKIIHTLYTLVDELVEEHTPAFVISETAEEDWERLSTKITSFKDLPTDKEKRSFIVQWAKEKSKDLEKIEDEKERKKYVIKIISMYKAELENRKKVLKRRTEIESRLGDDPIGQLEGQISRSTDGLTKKLFKIASDGARNKHFPPEAYFEYLINIRGKQYRHTADLKGCIKQWSALQSNVKTSMSVDFSTVCPKKIELYEMLERGVEVTVANNPTCIYCYVESARDIKKKNPKFFLAKAEKSDLRYQGDIAKMQVAKIMTLNRMGGLRFFSSGDYIENVATDEMIEGMIKDAEQVGLQFKVITKQDRFVKKYGARVFQEGPLKGRSVFNINISVDEQKGFPLVLAKQIKSKSPNNNIKIRVVAFNPKDALKYAKDKDVDVITLLHFSSRGRMKNPDLFVNMRPGGKGWDKVVEMVKKDLGSDAMKVLSKICCSTTGGCKNCPLACGFNPFKTSDFIEKVKGGKVKMKFPALVSK